MAFFLAFTRGVQQKQQVLVDTEHNNEKHMWTYNYNLDSQHQIGKPKLDKTSDCPVWSQAIIVDAVDREKHVHISGFPSMSTHFCPFFPPLIFLSN